MAKQAQDESTASTGADAEAGNRFFGDVGASRWLPPGVPALDAVTVVVCTLLRRVTGGLARELIRSAPQPVRDALHTCTERRPEAPEGFNRDMYVRRIGMLLGLAEDRAELLARDVFLAIHSGVARSASVGRY
jgi:uncharacterized protein (DUF2267 family)